MGSDLVRAHHQRHLRADPIAPGRRVAGAQGHPPRPQGPRVPGHVPDASDTASDIDRRALVELLPAADAATGSATQDAARRATVTAGLLLDRYGVVTRGAVQAEGVPGGFAQAYRVLAGFEEAGHCRRGYVIEKLGAAQFAASATVDRLRTFAGLADPPPRKAVTLAATDPANPYGAALGWPRREGVSHRPGRKAGGLVVLVDGSLVLYLERGGRTVLSFSDDEDVLRAAASDLAATARAEAPRHPHRREGERRGRVRHRPRAGTAGGGVRRHAPRIHAAQGDLSGGAIA